MGPTEPQVNEIEEHLNPDPIECRLKNVLKTGMKNTQGAVPAGQMRADEILQKISGHPIWRDRDKRKKKFEADNPGKFYGVGFACVQKDFGTGAESSSVKVEISPQGKILLRQTGTEIGKIGRAHV